MDDKKVCEYCGAILSQYERFCPECGSEYTALKKSKGVTSLQQSISPDVKDLSQRVAKPYKVFSELIYPVTRKKLLVGGILVVLALTLISAALYVPSSTTSTATANRTAATTAKTGVTGNITVAPTPTSIPTPMPIVPSTPTPTPTSAPIPTPMPTPEPTPGPMPTPMPTPIPTPEPTPVPPWIIK